MILAKLSSATRPGRPSAAAGSSCQVLRSWSNYVMTWRRPMYSCVLYGHSHHHGMCIRQNRMRCHDHLVIIPHAAVMVRRQKGTRSFSSQNHWYDQDNDDTQQQNQHSWEGYDGNAQALSSTMVTMPSVSILTKDDDVAGELIENTSDQDDIDAVEGDQMQEFSNKAAPRTGALSWAYSKAIFALRVIKRMAFLATLFVPLIISYPLHYIGVFKPFTGFSYPLSFYHHVLWAVDHAGATIVKLAQWASTRGDILDPLFCETIQKLLHDAKSHEWSHTERIMTRAFGPVSEWFEYIDTEPIGSGCIGQVYRGRLNAQHAFESGYSNVAIKVRHPGIVEKFQTDLFLLRQAARLFHTLIPGLQWVQLKAQVALFEEAMLKQLDFRDEAENLLHFHRIFVQAERHPDVCFPTPVYPLVDERVLVESFESGLPILSFLPSDEESEKSSNSLYPFAIEESWKSYFRFRMTNIGLRSYFRMVFKENFTHSDLHPGNILVRFVPTSVFDVTTWIDSFAFVIERISHRLFVGDVGKSLTTEQTSQLDHVSTSAWSDFVGQQQQSRSVFPPISTFHWYRPQLVFLDAGLVTVLGKDQQRDIVDEFYAIIIERDGYHGAKLMIERAPPEENLSSRRWTWSDDESDRDVSNENTGPYDPYHNVIEPEKFCRKIESIIDSLFQGFTTNQGEETDQRSDDSPNSSTLSKDHSKSGLSLHRVDLANRIGEVYSTFRYHHVRLDHRFVNLISSALVLEGLGRQLSPRTMDILALAIPYVRSSLIERIAKEFSYISFLPPFLRNRILEREKEKEKGT